MAAKTSWHRYGTKLRHCHPMYKRHNNLFFKLQSEIVLISNHNSFRVLFDKSAPAYFISEIYLYFIIGNGQPRKPTLCQWYRHTFVLYLRAFTTTNTSRSFTYKMAAIINWHRYGTIHCLPMYKL